METKTRKIIGILLAIVGFTIGMEFAGNTAGYRLTSLESILHGLSYIGGFTIAFIGLFLVFYRDKSQRTTQ